jgi:hypothetical protein
MSAVGEDFLAEKSANQSDILLLNKVSRILTEALWQAETRPCGRAIQ